MREFFIQCAEALVEREDACIVYDAIASKFHEDYFPQGLVNALSALYHKFPRNDILLDIAEIIDREEVENKTSYKFYYKYFMKEYPELFEKFSKAYEKENGKLIAPKEDVFEKYKEYPDMIDFLYRHIILVDIMTYLSYFKGFDLVLEISKYLSKVDENLDNYIKSKNILVNPKSLYQDYNKEFSKELSSNEYHNDINNYAISLDKKNQTAYINILDDLLTYKTEQEAFDFYNNVYSKEFIAPRIEKLSDLYWFMSTFYKDAYYFYKCLLYEKRALELDVINGV